MFLRLSHELNRVSSTANTSGIKEVFNNSDISKIVCPVAMTLSIIYIFPVGISSAK